jgi:hypothetical protein
MVKRGAFMIQTRGVESLVDLHRRELISQAGSGRSRRAGRSTRQDRAMQRSAAGLPVTDGRAVRRAVAPRVGGWLIDFGTKLGGTAVRTTN